MSVYVDGTLIEFFEPRVERAFHSDLLLRGQDVISEYIVGTIDRLARTDKILVVPPARTTVVSLPLAPPVYLELLQHIGDSTLLTNSFFPSFLYDNKISPDENRELGVLAYRRIANSYSRKSTGGRFFRRLGDLYPNIEDALSTLRTELGLDTWEAFLKRFSISQ